MIDEGRGGDPGQGRQMIQAIGALGVRSALDGHDQAAAFLGMQFHAVEPLQLQRQPRGKLRAGHQQDAADVIFVHLGG